MVVGCGRGVIGLVSSEWPPLLYPLALLSGLMIVGLVGAVNTMLALVLLRREGAGGRMAGRGGALFVGADVGADRTDHESSPRRGADSTLWTALLRCAVVSGR